MKGNHVSNRLEESTLAGREPIAIVGIGCRFPGIDTIESFWRVVRDGIETVGEYPGGRFSLLDTAYSSTEIATSRGGFLRNLSDFDAGFFGISPREAELLDPQQRLLLEVAWEALEDAGIPAGKLAGGQTGVFVGTWTSDYEACIRDLVPRNFFATTGTGRYATAGRLAYFFDLRGPALSVDTACSSSLVAIHLACRSLWSGESRLALAGGANVILRPEVTLAYSDAGMLSPDGRSKFGDAAANGYVRSEGAGMVVLKLLAHAQADRDPIYALIRGSAMNNDGRSSGQMISPSREGQETVLRAAFGDAGVVPEDIDYMEAHGTGTAAGDPVEIETIGRVMAGEGRKRPCSVGSVKTNIGHTESAAGVAGVIKAALALQRGIIPASLHFQRPNPAIAWNDLPVAIQTKTALWPQDSVRRMAGVSAFGITGTNAHVVLESAPPSPQTESSPECSRLYLLSAHTTEALRHMAASWRARLSDDPSWPASMADLAFTAATRRTHHEFRLAVTAGDRAQLHDRLTAWLRDEPCQGVVSGRQMPAARRKVFVFPGQGGQWVGMGRGLLQKETVFRDVVEECDRVIRKHTGWSVLERLRSAEGESGFSDVDVVQPTLFAVMVGLAALWRSWGIEPDAVVGHSMGESVAAVVSGALTLEDAAAVICHRSSLMKRASGRGSMAITQLSLEEATQLAFEYNGRFSVAANNSPTTTVISGDTNIVEQALAELEGRDVFCRWIKVDVASHSAHMDPLREELAQRLKGLQPRVGTIPFYSTTTGEIESGAELNADYWARNLRQPVLFSAAVKQLLAEGFDTFLEINAHPVLGQAVEECARQKNRAIVTACCLHREQDEYSALLDSAGTLIVNGLPVKLDRLYPKGACVSLPTYPWQRERHWLDTDSVSANRSALLDKTLSERVSCVDHIYELRWTRGNPLGDRPATSRTCWLVVGEPGLGDQIADRMEAAGDACIRLVNANQVQSALESYGALCEGVVHVAARGIEPGDAIQETYHTVRLVQALATGGTADPPRLWLLTSGSFQLPGDSAEVSVAGGSAWGLARVIAREYPELRCVNVDLGSTPSLEELDTFLRLLRQDGPEEQIAVRGGDYFVARYETNTDVNACEPANFRPDATYLITGGLGGIGLELARWLTVRGARHIALVGRRAPSDDARKRIAAIELLGASVRVFSADVSDETQLASTIEIIAEQMPQLRGVFHLSAVTDGALLANLTEERLQRVMGPKASGAWNLHRKLELVDLDSFVLFSSIAAAYGQPGVGNYTAANACMDSLARYRRARGLPALSIQWCPWTAIGLANNQRGQHTAKLYQDQGVSPISTEKAFDALGRMMLLDAPVLLVMPTYWERFARSFENNQMPRAFLKLAAPPALDTPDHSKETVRERLVKAIPGQPRRTVIETLVQQIAARVLKTAVNRVDLTKPFGSMGVNSLMALELVRHLSATTGVRLPATAVFNHPTIILLAEELARLMGIPLEEKELAAASLVAIDTPSSTLAANEISDAEAISALVGQNRNAE